ncbi:hypothetical protein O181_058772 [Austropuccinia psidii MF-1]|uniref:Reverse transcriptase RNase H-like domain-containing protein n=1 Tax=Austropuccinia psidii MF-1 TaxID=1389203 RepID=A0A9Q3HWS2_9BASI|nr:hypothetical protein [Austropuccinia psidii MF-1]
MKEDLIEILFHYWEGFASDNEPLGHLKGHEVNIMLNFEIPYPLLSRKSAYPASPRARESLETHINFKLPFELYIYECCEAVGSALHQVQIVNNKPYEDPICFTSRQRNPNEARYGESQMGFLCLFWAWEKLHYHIDGSVSEVITDFNAMKSLLNMKTPNRNTLILHISEQEYKGNMTILHKAGNINKNYDCWSRWELPNTPENTACVLENAAPQILIEVIKITNLGTELFQEVRESYNQDASFHILTSLIDKDFTDSAWDNYLDDIGETSNDNGRFCLFNGILYHRSKQTFLMVLFSRILIKTILLECHDKIYSVNLSEDRKMERINTTS